MKRLIILFVVGLAAGFGAMRIASAQDAGVVVDVGSAAPTPSDALHNPVDDPAAALSDAKEAKKQGWALFSLSVLVMSTAGLARASNKWPSVPGLSWFARHKTALLVTSGIGITAAAAYNALVLGGSWYATLAAAAGAALALVAPKKAAE